MHIALLYKLYCNFKSQLCLCCVILYYYKSREQLVFGVDVFVYISCTYGSLCEAQEPSTYKYSTFILLSIA